MCNQCQPRTEPSGETIESPSQEADHSAQTLEVSQDSLPRTPPTEEQGVREKRDDKQPERKAKIKWPKSNQKQEWKTFEEDLGGILDTTLGGPTVQKIRTMTTFIYNVGAERFGTTEFKKKTDRKGGPSRRQKKISEIRKQLRSLRRRWKEAKESNCEEQMTALKELRDGERDRLKSLRKAEQSAKKRKTKERARSAFLKNPYGFAKKTLGENRSGEMECTREELENHLRQTHSDPMRDEELEILPELDLPPPPTFAFDESDIKWKEVSDTVRKSRSKSAPGPSGIPYLVSKRCPALLRRLWKLLKVLWKKGTLPQEWMLADGFYVPKEENSENIDQFRGISLLSVEAKIYFSVFASRITSYMVNNNYLDTSVQKGGISGFSGCIEHNCVISQLLHEVKTRKGDLTLIWLDLANAYGSVPHRLIDLAMTRYFLPMRIQELVLMYYHKVRVRFSTRTFTTSPQRVEKGIVTGCTISVILFVMAFNLLIKTAESECRGPVTRSGSRQPSIRGFMDDLTITTESATGGRWILKALDKLVTWARMEFKTRKSRSVVIRRGKVTDNCIFKLQGENIPTLKDVPIKCLGKWYHNSLDDKENVKRFKEETIHGLMKIEDSNLPGKFKVWVLQHTLIPKMRWPMMLYEIPVTTMEAVERKINSKLKAWLGIPRSLCKEALYSTSTKLQLPFSSVTEEYKVSRAGVLLTIRDSKDPKVATSGIELRSGRSG